MLRMSSPPVRQQEKFAMGTLWLSVYLPTILYSIGEGAVIPIVPLFARDLGASVPAASLIVAMRGVGQLLFDVPAGVFVSKFGDKGAMVLGTLLVAGVAVTAVFTPTPLVLAPLMLLMGGGWSFWQLARLAYITEEASLGQRGRAMSMLGGMQRVGQFIGPVLGGLIADHFGLAAPFVLQAFLGISAAAMMFVIVRNGSGSEHVGTHGLGGRLVSTVTDNRAIFVRTAFPMIALGILRQARQVFLPLWGDEIGLSVSEIGIVASLSFGIDAAVFYPIGILMDRWGRKWAAVPCLGTLGIGLIILPLTHNLLPFLMVAFLSGLGNGFGSGIVMTLGADFAPDVGRGEFLGVWRLVADIGQASGPAIIAGLSALASLAIASVASGGIGLVGAAMLFMFVPETLGKAAELVTLTSPESG
jgi:MFS family permease